MNDLPLLIEFAGLPASGKTTVSQMLSDALTRAGYENVLIPEAAARCPFIDLKGGWEYTAWIVCEIVQDVLTIVNTSKTPIVILDRGLLDALCWVRWLEHTGRIHVNTARALRTFLTVDEWFQRTKLVLWLSVEFETAFARRGHTGRIVNPQVFSELGTAYEKELGGAGLSSDAAEIFNFSTDQLTKAEAVETALTCVRKELLAPKLNRVR